MKSFEKLSGNHCHWSTFQRNHPLWSSFYFTAIYTLITFIKTKALILAKNLRTSLEQSQACCVTEHKNSVARLVILKITRTKYQNRAWLSFILCCMQTNFKIAKVFNGYIPYSKNMHLSNLFVYYTLGSSDSLFSSICHLSSLGVWKRQEHIKNKIP